MSDEEMFHHEVAQWTVGQLRAALDGIPDDTPVVVDYAEAPGGDSADEQVVIAAAPRMAVWNPGTQSWDETSKPVVFEIEVDFPTGDYYRPSR